MFGRSRGRVLLTAAVMLGVCTGMYGQAKQGISIGTHAVTGAYYAMGAGIAKVINENTQVQATVYPYSGPDAWMPEMRENTINMGVLSGVDLAWAYRGQVVFNKPTPQIRLVVNGNSVNHCTFAVAKSSGITSIKQLKGKRVGYGYGGNKFTVLLVDAALASVGLTINDCVQVPLTDLTTAQRALQERRVDAIFAGSATTPSSVQLDQSLGIAVLPFGDMRPSELAKGVPKKMQDILDKYVPGATVSVSHPEGIIKQDTVLIEYPIDLAASSSVNADVVYSIMDALWKKYGDLASANAWGSGWTPENFPTDLQPAPYHDGAVKFLKDKKLWTPDMQARQDYLLKK